MHVCVIAPILDAYKGGNHLPLLAACSNTQFTILTNRTKPENPELPSNVSVITLQKRLGPFEYGVRDTRFAQSVLSAYPPKSDFWKQFDVIHLNQTLGAGFVKLNATGLPVLYAIHHPVTADRQVAVAETGAVGSLIWSAQYLPMIRGQKKLCKNISHLMTVSQTMRTRIAKDYACDPQKISVVKNGVDGDVFTPVDDTDHDIIAVGSFLHPRKGFRYLIEVYKALSKKGYTIADVGRRSDEQRAALEKINNLTVYNVVEADQLVSLIQHSECLISTSLFEGFGLSLIEALSCNRPAFAFDVGAVREVLAPIDPSLIIQPRDVRGMNERVDQYLRSDKREEYRSKVLELYSMEKSASALEALYQSLAY
jgi:glycosyltransferase involved in cell wall biosynthesis